MSENKFSEALRCGLKGKTSCGKHCSTSEKEHTRDHFDRQNRMRSGQIASWAYRNK